MIVIVGSGVVVLFVGRCVLVGAFVMGIVDA